jgi:hypothetical protein
MKEFMLVFRNAGMGDFKPTPEQIQQVEKQWADWFATIAVQGKLSGGIRPAPEGKTVRPGNVVTDGPYAEIKEILMGATLVKTDSIEEAVEIAKGCPILLIGGTVEVRPTVNMDM